MVFEYLEFDLYGLLSTPAISLSATHFKSWSHQLLSGVFYMHFHGVLHRDLKTANILVSSTGVLKIADWGLARSCPDSSRPLTTNVITLWYRPPELLLGSRVYGAGADVWSCGCILGELFKRRPLLQGAGDAEQINLIFSVVGLPTQENWPDARATCKDYEKVVGRWDGGQGSNNGGGSPSSLKSCLLSSCPVPDALSPDALDLITSLLKLDPRQRLPAKDALEHPYFMSSSPPLIIPGLPVAGGKSVQTLDMEFGKEFKSLHEFEARGRATANAGASHHQRKPAPAAAAAAFPTAGGGANKPPPPRAYPTKAGANPTTATTANAGAK